MIYAHWYAILIRWHIPTRAKPPISIFQLGNVMWSSEKSVSRSILFSHSLVSFNLTSFYPVLIFFHLFLLFFFAFFFCLFILPYANYKLHTHSATGYAIEPRLKQIQDEDAGHVFREATSASSISDSVNRINKNQYNYRDEVDMKCFFNFH